MHHALHVFFIKDLSFWHHGFLDHRLSGSTKVTTEEPLAAHVSRGQTEISWGRRKKRIGFAVKSHNGFGFLTSGVLVAYWVCYEYDSVIYMKYVEWMQRDGHQNYQHSHSGKIWNAHWEQDRLDMVTRRVSSRQQRKHPAKKPGKINQALRKRKNKVRTEAPLHLSSSLATIQKSWNWSTDDIDAGMFLWF